MELEDMKTTWQSIKPQINSQITEFEARKVFPKRNDIKSNVLKRVLWDGILTIISLSFMAASPFWSPIGIPYWWLVMFCAPLFIGSLCCFRIYRSVKAIDLWADSHQKVFNTIISIKKQYRNIELMIALIIIPLLVLLSFTPSFIHTWRMFLVWGLTLLACCIEYIWYKSNIRKLSNIVDWDKY